MGRFVNAASEPLEAAATSTARRAVSKQQQDRPFWPEIRDILSVADSPLTPAQIRAKLILRRGEDVPPPSVRHALRERLQCGFGTPPRPESSGSQPAPTEQAGGSFKLTATLSQGPLVGVVVCRVTTLGSRWSSPGEHAGSYRT